MRERSLTPGILRGDHVASLSAAVQQRIGVVITYRSADDPLSHDFLLFPRAVYARNGHEYVVGWSAHRPTRVRLRRSSPRFRNSGMIRTFRLDRVLAVTERPARTWSVLGHVGDQVRFRGIRGALPILLIDAYLLGGAVIMVLLLAAWLLGDDPFPK